MPEWIYMYLKQQSCTIKTDFKDCFDAYVIGILSLIESVTLIDLQQFVTVNKYIKFNIKIINIILK